MQWYKAYLQANLLLSSLPREVINHVKVVHNILSQRISVLHSIQWVIKMQTLSSFKPLLYELGICSINLNARKSSFLQILARLKLQQYFKTLLSSSFVWEAGISYKNFQFPTRVGLYFLASPQHKFYQWKWESINYCITRGFD